MSTQLTSTSSHMGAVLGKHSRIQVTWEASVTFVGEGHDLHHARDGSTWLQKCCEPPNF